MTAPTVDARGMRCPWPALRAARLLREKAGAIEVLADDPAAERELSALALARGLRLEVLGREHFRFVPPDKINTLFTRDP